MRLPAFTRCARDADESEEVEDRPGDGISFTALLLILAADFGDKTQIAVAGLAGSMQPLPVWVGATAALIIVSVLGIWAGRTLSQNLSLRWLHRLWGGIRFLFVLVAGWRALA